MSSTSAVIIDRFVGATEKLTQKKTNSLHETHMRMLHKNLILWDRSLKLWKWSLQPIVCHVSSAVVEELFNYRAEVYFWEAVENKSSLGSQHYNWHFGSDCKHNWSYALNVPHIVKHMPCYGRCRSIVRDFMRFLYYWFVICDVEVHKLLGKINLKIKQKISLIHRQWACFCLHM